MEDILTKKKNKKKKIKTNLFINIIKNYNN